MTIFGNNFYENFFPNVYYVYNGGIIVLLCVYREKQQRFYLLYWSIVYYSRVVQIYEWMKWIWPIVECWLLLFFSVDNLMDEWLNGWSFRFLFLFLNELFIYERYNTQQQQVIFIIIIYAIAADIVALKVYRHFFFF